MIIFMRNKWPKPIWPRDDHVGLPEKFQQFLLTGRWALLDPYQVQFSSVQFSRSIMSNSLGPHESHMPGLPIHYQLPEFTQTRAHWVSDAIQPSRPLSSPSPPAPNPSQHQGLFQWVKSSHEVARVLEFQLQPQSFQWTPRSMSQFKRVSQRSPDIHTRVSKQAGTTHSFGQFPLCFCGYQSASNRHGLKGTCWHTTGLYRQHLSYIRQEGPAGCGRTQGKEALDLLRVTKKI